MIEIELVELEIISILKGNAEVITTHPEITKSDLKKAALDTLKGLATVESYQGNITEILTENIIQFPAALVIYGGAKDDNEKGREGARGKVIVSFSVFVIGQNLMGSPEASLDVRKMLTAVRTILNGFIYDDEGKERTLLWMAESLEMISNTGTCAFEQTYQYIDWLIT